jgi:hypothetical protein
MNYIVASFEGVIRMRGANDPAADHDYSHKNTLPYSD